MLRIERLENSHPDLAEFIRQICVCYNQKRKLIKIPSHGVVMIRNGRFVDRDGNIRSTKEPGRNKPCPCGSGKKYKKCCGEVIMIDKHTPIKLPVFDSSNEFCGGYSIHDASGKFICRIRDKEILDLILNALNSHDKLIKALEKAIDDLNEYIGEWQAVAKTYCSVDVASIKDIIDNLEDVFAEAKESK